MELRKTKKSTAYHGSVIIIKRKNNELAIYQFTVSYSRWQHIFLLYFVEVLEYIIATDSVLLIEYQSVFFF